tara:strand:+ start:2055 stop:2474 length:420 start_codon:yes stop_codon:yes gene_type:complete
MQRFAFGLVKQAFPVAGLARKTLSRKIGKYAKAIVGGSPVRPRKMTDRVLMLVLPAVILELYLPSSSRGFLKDFSTMAREVLTTTGTSAKVISVISKQRVKLNSLSRYALFCLLYIAMNKREEIIPLVRSRGGRHVSSV